MKKSTFFLFLIVPLIFGYTLTQAQCTPGDENSCPDPENNGQICPDTVAPVIQGEPYGQEITMLPPSEIDTLNITAELYYIKLISIEGLPEGIEWVTNTDDNIFESGTYYCILFSGTSNAAVGTYPIKIEVNLYVNFFGDTLEVPGIIDSTSISMAVIPDFSSVTETNSLVSKVWPNPFQNDLNIELNSSVSSEVKLDVYNMLGQAVFSKRYPAGSISGMIRLEAAHLPKGMYFLSLEHNNKRYTQLVSRTH